MATHYYNPDDEREIKGVADPNKINDLYQQQLDDESNKLNADLDHSLNDKDNAKGGNP